MEDHELAGLIAPWFALSIPHGAGRDASRQEQLAWVDEAAETVESGELSTLDLCHGLASSIESGGGGRVDPSKVVRFASTEGLIAQPGARELWPLSLVGHIGDHGLAAVLRALLYALEHPPRVQG